MAVNSLVGQGTPPRTGLTLVAVRSFTALSTLSLDGCFSSQYENYKIVLRLSVVTAGAVGQVRLRAAGVDNSAAAYTSTRSLATGTSASAETSSSGTTAWTFIPGNATTSRWLATLDIACPAVAEQTLMTGTTSVVNAGGSWYATSEAHYHTAATAFDGLTLFVASGTITGVIYVYGYAKSVDQFGPYTQIPQGMDLIVKQDFIASAAVNFSNCFSSLYENYQVNVTLTACSAGLTQIQFRERLAGVDAVDATYGHAYMASSGVQGSATSSQTSATVFYGNTNGAGGTLYLSGVNIARTSIGRSVGYRNDATAYAYDQAIYHGAATAYDGFSMYPLSGTMTGTIRVYGYRNG